LVPKASFIRIHRSYIVPLAKIQTLHHKKVKIGTEQLPVGESYLPELKAALAL
jgi:DNA-binding LytR/AlgR family response regulator